MIVNLGLQGEVATRFQILETLAEREQGVGQVIERSEMENDVELPRAAECFGCPTRTRMTRPRGQETPYLDMTWADVYAGREK